MNQAELCRALSLSLSFSLSLSIYISIYIYKCLCVLTGLDADLLTVLPALSRHPSLKHLYLGKNFNIKNRCCRFSLSRFTAAVCVCVCVCVCLSVCVWTRGCMHCICQLGCTRLWFYFRPHKRLPLLGPKARRQQEMTRASSYSLVSVFVSTLSVRRVLDEVLQKLVQLIQEEDCVSEKRGRCPHSLKDTVRCRVNSSPAPGSLH